MLGDYPFPTRQVIEMSAKNSFIKISKPWIIIADLDPFLG
jgi:hypothetical protein